MISIIIPTFNEAKNIAQLIINIRKNSGADILVVDDNSADGTANIARKNKAIVIENKAKLGLGHAYIQGMEYAINNLGADVLIEMDADFSHDPKYLKQLEEHMKKYDIVLGSRYIKGGSIPKEWALHRKFISYFGNKIISLFLGNVKDWSSGYRAIRKEVFLKLKDKVSRHSGYTFQVAFLNEAKKAGYSIKEIPIHFRERRYGESKMKLEYIFNTFRYIIADSQNNKPKPLNNQHKTK